MKIKTNLLSKIVVLTFLLFTFTVASQDDVNLNGNIKLSFPEAYFGIYKGDLQISSQNGTTTIPMEFHLLPIEGDKEHYHYTIVYITNAVRQERKYTLITKNA